MRHTHGQVALFIILGLIVAIIVGFMVMTTQTIEQSEGNTAIEQIGQGNTQLAQITDFVTQCVELTVVDGLKLLVSQGGVIYQNQGGTVLDLDTSKRDVTYAVYSDGTTEWNVSYNILAQNLPVGIAPNAFSPTLPAYPRDNFPYTDDTYTTTSFNYGLDVFGKNTLPPLNASNGPHSFQLQLETFVGSHIGQCIDFSSFENQGFDISAGALAIDVGLYANQLIATLNFPLDISHAQFNLDRTVSEFAVTVPVRIGTMHSILDTMITTDVQDITYDIASHPSVSTLVINDVNGDRDDVIIVQDPESILDAEPFEYVFVRKNRAPALHYLTPAEREIVVQSGSVFANNADFQENVTSQVTIQQFDPDEDVVTLTVQPSLPVFPLTIASGSLNTTIRATDGAFTDTNDLLFVRGAP